MKRVFSLLLVCLWLVPAGAQVRDSIKVLCIGNSFTYFYDSHLALVEIAASQGHHIDMRAEYVGGFTFRRHLMRDQTIDAIERPNPSDGYDVVFLQNQSQLNARYAADPDRFAYALADAEELSGRVKQYSPVARVFFESTWSYPAADCGGFGSLEKFDRLLDEGTQAFACRAGGEVSYIGRAFALARVRCPDIDLLGDDLKHQSAYGTYLKACVNYLAIYGGGFDDNASSCGLDPDKTRRLREVAELSSQRPSIKKAP